MRKLQKKSLCDVSNLCDLNCLLLLVVSMWLALVHRLKVLCTIVKYFLCNPEWTNWMAAFWYTVQNTGL